MRADDDDFIRRLTASNCGFDIRTVDAFGLEFLQAYFVAGLLKFTFKELASLQIRRRSTCAPLADFCGQSRQVNAQFVAQFHLLCRQRRQRALMRFAGHSDSHAGGLRPGSFWLALRTAVFGEPSSAADGDQGDQQGSGNSNGPRLAATIGTTVANQNLSETANQPK